MKPLFPPTPVLLLLVATPLPAFEPLATLDDALNFANDDGSLRLNLSGTLDLEYYRFDGLAPGLLYTNENELLNPRFTMSADAQIGSSLYAFAQARVDRGFDPADAAAEMRLDTLALRYTPWEDGRFSIQAGKFATGTGAWPARSYSWQNPFVTAPGPYETLTPMWDTEMPEDAAELRRWGHVLPIGRLPTRIADKYLRIPLVWGPAYATGVAVMGQAGDFNYYLEMKDSGLSSNPEVWDLAGTGFSHPSFSGRIGWRPNMMWRLGLSASVGPYLRDTALARASLPVGMDIGDYRQIMLSQDISFEWHHWQFWMEMFQARFEMPFADVDTFAYYLEAKYKFSPQWFAALRFNHHLYGDVPVGAGSELSWGADLVRLDSALGWRPSPHTQVKLQLSGFHEDSVDGGWGYLLATQVTARF